VRGSAFRQVAARENKINPGRETGDGEERHRSSGSDTRCVGSRALDQDIDDVTKLPRALVKLYADIKAELQAAPPPKSEAMDISNEVLRRTGDPPRRRS
jgi:hypothetical protein